MSTSPGIMSSDPPDYLRIKRICWLTGLSRSAVQRAIERGELASVRYGSMVLVPRESYERWLSTAFVKDERTRQLRSASTR